MKIIQLPNGNKIKMNIANLTVKKRKEVLKMFEKKSVVLTEDKVILAELKEKFKANPPTEMEIYEGFLRLQSNVFEEEDREPYFEELSRVCCKWLNEDGSDGAYITREEYDNLPFDAAQFILQTLNSEEEKGFLEMSPETTSA